jgi:hypothetical protein
VTGDAFSRWPLHSSRSLTLRTALYNCLIASLWPEFRSLTHTAAAAAAAAGGCLLPLF